MQTSTLPSLTVEPPIKRREPFVQLLPATGTVRNREKGLNVTKATIHHSNSVFGHGRIKIHNPIATWTFDSRMICIVTHRWYATNPTVNTVEYPALSSSAADRIKPDWPTYTAIEWVEAWNCTYSRELIINWKNEQSMHMHLTLPSVEYPSCLQTTSASWLLQPESQMLPQVRLTQTWTVPVLVVDPCTRRTLPSVQLSGGKGAKVQKNSYGYLFNTVH